MSWLSAITYFQISSSEIPSCSFESRQDHRTRVENRNYYVNGVESENTFQVTVPYEVEQRRVVTTVTTTAVYECRGVARDIALAAKYEHHEYDAGTGNETIETVVPTRSNEADGWTVTRTLITVTVTRGNWADYTEA